MDTKRIVIAAIGPYDLYHPDNLTKATTVRPVPEVDDVVLAWSLEPTGDVWWEGEIVLEKYPDYTYVMAQIQLSEAPEFDVDLDADPEFLQLLNPDLEIPGAEQVAETSTPAPLSDDTCGKCQRLDCEECFPEECSVGGRCTGWCDKNPEKARGECVDNRIHPQVEAEQNEITAEEIASRLPTDSAARKDVPLARGVLDYFPDALAEVARLSKVGNDKHNPGEDLHWARDKSKDHADCIMRHLVERGEIDTDGLSHTVKVAWRALALLQEELEAAGAPMSRGSRG